MTMATVTTTTIDGQPPTSASISLTATATTICTMTTAPAPTVIRFDITSHHHCNLFQYQPSSCATTTISFNGHTHPFGTTTHLTATTTIHVVQR